MLHWFANFSIPNSGIQAANVYAFVEEDNTVVFYANPEKTTMLFSKQYTIPRGVDPYDFLLTLEEFQQYSKL